MCFAPQRRAIFGHRKLEKCPVPVSFFILTGKYASRHSAVPFCRIGTSKIAMRVWCFVHFDLKMGFAPQWRTILEHVNFENCSAIVVFCAFWLENGLRATVAYHFWTCELRKLLRDCGVLCILTWKCSSRHSGVPFFIFLRNSYLRTRRFSEATFRTSGTRNHWKNAPIRGVPNIWRTWSFFVLTFRVRWFFSTDSTRVLIFFLLIWHLYSAFQLCGVDISTLLFKSANCRKLDLETSFDKYISRRHVGVHSCIYIQALQWYQLFGFFPLQLGVGLVNLTPPPGNAPPLRNKGSRPRKLTWMAKFQSHHFGYPC